MKLPTTVLAAAMSLAAFGESATAWSPAAAIDLRDGNLCRVAPVAVSYSPDFVTGTNTPGGTVEMLAISHYGTYHPSTQALATVSSPSVGSVTLGTAEDAGTAYHIVLRAFSGSSLLGEISADVGLAVDSGFSHDTLADMQTNKLQRAVDAGASVLNLAYDTAWTDGTARLALTCTDSTPGRNDGIASTIAEFPAPAGGAFAFGARLVYASHAFRLTAYDSNGAVVGEPLEASYTYGHPGVILFFR